MGAIVFVGGIIGAVFYALKTSDAYQLGVSRLQDSAAAASALGAPVSTGIPSGKISINGESGSAALAFSATGTKASGQVTLEAVKKNGVWSLTTLKLKVDGRDDEIDLLKESRVEIERFRSACWNRPSLAALC